VVSFTHVQQSDTNADHTDVSSDDQCLKNNRLRCRSQNTKPNSFAEECSNLQFCPAQYALHTKWTPRIMGVVTAHYLCTLQQPLLLTHQERQQVSAARQSERWSSILQHPVGQVILDVFPTCCGAQAVSLLSASAAPEMKVSWVPPGFRTTCVTMTRTHVMMIETI
jgi:hypothetical protein